MRSECGARVRSRKPLPGGSGPPLGRHDDRSPRSSVDSRQATTDNTRRAASQETRELELSQRRMRSPWRVPQQSAGRRARPARARCRPERRREWRNLRALVCMAAMVGMRLSARCSLFHCRERIYFCVVVVRKARVRSHRESEFVYPPARGAGEGDHPKHGGGGMRRRGQPRGRRPFHRVGAIAGACIGVLDLKYGGQRPPMPPSPLRGAG